ncbi:MAG: NAD(P)H-binding protein, partial [Gammaproteobacteria bacterium]
MKHINIVLLGGSGFIGKHLAFELANRGCTVTIPCRRPHRNKDLLVHPNIRVIQSSVFEPGILDSLFQGQDAVINLIGILHQRKSSN